MSILLVDVRESLQGIKLPATQGRLLEYAMLNEADLDIIAALEGMPEKRYRTLMEIEQEYV